jgi:hypothetical protein
MRTHGRTVAIVLAALLVAGAVVLWLRTRKPVVGSG